MPLPIAIYYGSLNRETICAFNSQHLLYHTVP